MESAVRPYGETYTTVYLGQGTVMSDGSVVADYLGIASVYSLEKDTYVRGKGKTSGAKAGGGESNLLESIIGGAITTAGYFESAYIAEAGTEFVYGQRINGVVRSASTLTRVNRISSMSAARGFSRTGTGLTILSAGVTVIDGLTNENGWQNHHTADLLVTGGFYTTAAFFPVVGWVAGGLYFAADLTTQYYTGKSITQNLFDN